MQHEQPMSLRERLARTLSFGPVAPPRFESEFADDTVQRWREEGRFDDLTPARFFHLDSFEWLPLEFRLERERRPIVKIEDDMEAFQQSFLALRNKPFPGDWNTKEWEERTYPLAAAPWDEGFFQVIGIHDGATLSEALEVACERPALVEQQMDFYVHYLAEILENVLRGVTIDFAIYYEPIASNHGIVISPEMYRHFVQPVLRRIVACLERHGARHHFIWSSGHVEPLIPVWLETGINGFLLSRGAECGMNYLALRRKFGMHICFFGGIDWRAVMEGPAALQRELDVSVRPLLEQGGYVPFLNDTVRSYMSFDCFQRYRAMLDAVVSEWPP
ncbi:MAG TPA: uroporphyrinogen decarboxylase family protein [Candidatus Hydrogenedentes bacterium]|nr:uroporphyrinogen decarboxylase family protein [Candidatus Hydrogenedentota bacterium]HQM51277.1 uroporphyrinogen decarboxylase family protein [Candidatus Hydrogenedentota bacterium]